MSAPFKKIHVVFNAQSGTAQSLGLTPDALREKLREAAHVIEIDASDDRPLDARVDAALKSDADVIVAAGGDGTVTALANALVGTGKTLAVLPLGTANLLARDLGIPLDIDAATAELSAMKPRNIDVAELNGRVFLHKAVIGTFPEIAEARENVRGDGSLSARLEFARYFLRRVSDARRIAVQIDPAHGGQKRVERAQAVAVANNSYDEGVGRFFSRERLDRGMLTLYVLKRLSLLGMVRLALEMVAGRWQQDRALAIEYVDAVELKVKRESVQVMIDGEVETVATPLAFRIRPLSLSVLSPSAGAQDEDRSENR